MELRVTQSDVRDTVHGRRRDHAAKGARHPVALVVGHDDKDVRRALGGTTDGGQYDLESLASSLITRPNFGGGGGSCLPSIVVVAAGDPGGAVFRSACLVASCADTTSA